MYCRDLKQLCDSLGNPKLPDQTSTEHNALNDARWNKQAYEFLVRQSAVPAPPSPAPIDRASWQAGVSAAIRQVANMKLFDVHGRYLADSIVRELQSLEPPL